MSSLTQGRPFHGEFSSTDASALSEANSRFTLYDAGNTPNAITLAANERVVITDFIVNYAGSTTRTIQIYDGPDATADAGEKVWQGALAQNGNAFAQFTVPHYCQTGPTNGYPKVKTSGAGQIDVIIKGIIQRNGQ
jgi:hypothetical protein